MEPYELGNWIRLWRCATPLQPGPGMVLLESIQALVIRRELYSGPDNAIVTAEDTWGRLFNGTAYRNSRDLFWFCYAQRMNLEELAGTQGRFALAATRIGIWSRYRLPDPKVEPWWLDAHALYSPVCGWHLWRNPDGSPAVPEGAHACEEHQRGYFEDQCPICRLAPRQDNPATAA